MHDCRTALRNLLLSPVPMFRCKEPWGRMLSPPGPYGDPRGGGGVEGISPPFPYRNRCAVGHRSLPQSFPSAPVDREHPTACSHCSPAQSTAKMEGEKTPCSLRATPSCYCPCPSCCPCPNLLCPDAQGQQNTHLAAEWVQCGLGALHSPPTLEHWGSI